MERQSWLVLGSAARDRTDWPLLCISAAQRIEMLLAWGLAAISPRISNAIHVIRQR
jgi:hypothetical protein